MKRSVRGGIAMERKEIEEGSKGVAASVSFYPGS